jgi:hypothetical protein
MLTTAMTRTTWRMLSLLLTVGAWAVLSVGARPAHADVCFSGGHHENPDANHPDGGDVRDGQVVGFRRASPTGRKSGTGLVLAAGLGLAWIGGRRKPRIGTKSARELRETAADRRPPTKRSP